MLRADLRRTRRSVVERRWTIGPAILAVSLALVAWSAPGRGSATPPPGNLDTSTIVGSPTGSFLTVTPDGFDSPVGAEFTAGSSGQLTGFELALGQVVFGPPTGPGPGANLIVSVWSAGASNLPAAELASTGVPSSDVPTTGLSLVDVGFGGGPDVAAGEKLFVVLSTDSAGTANQYDWYSYFGPTPQILAQLQFGTSGNWYQIGNGSPSPQGYSEQGLADYVGPAARPTSATLSASASELTAGSPVTFTETITPVPDGGTVDVIGVAGCASVPVGADGTVSCTGTLTRAGTYPVTGAYSGDATFAAATAQVTETVDPGPPASITSDGGYHSIGVGQTQGCCFTARVRDQYANPVPGATVTFTAPASGPSGTFVGGDTAVTGASGQAFSNPFTANSVGGTYDVVESVAGLSVTATDQVTNVVPTSATLSASASELTAGSPVTFTETITPVPDGGTVEFLGVAGCASVPLGAGGVASCTGTHTEAGTYPVTASYSGDVIFTAASAQVTETVDPGPPASITSDGGYHAIGVGQAQSSPFTATVRDQYANPEPGVVVTFSAPANGPSGTFFGGDTAVTNASGEAFSNTFTANSVGGTYDVVESVAGLSATATDQVTNVVPTPTTTAVSEAPNPAPAGAVVTDTATVSPTPSVGGTVTIEDNGTPVCSVPAQELGPGGTLVCQQTPTKAGAHQITASFSGDGLFFGPSQGTSTLDVFESSDLGVALVTPRRQPAGEVRVSARLIAEGVDDDNGVTLTATVTSKAPVSVQLPGGLSARFCAVAPGKRTGAVMTCHFGHLPAVASRNLAMVITGPSGRGVTVSATVTGALPDPDPSNNSTTSTFVIG